MTSQPIPSHIESLSTDIQLAAKAAFAAGKPIQAGYNELHDMEAKGVGDLVSEIDRQADEAAAKVLQTDELKRPILSEELSPELTTNSDNLWIVDPLDGTSAFLFKTGSHFSSVLIALRKDGETELGIVYFPVTGEWFYAEKGQGAFQDGLPIHSDQDCLLSSGWVELNQYSDFRFESSEFSALRNELRTNAGAPLVTQNAPYSGVAMRIADPETMLVACLHDNDPAHVKQAAWDIAAPQCILEEAGGVFINLAGDRVDPFKPEPFVVAANRKVADSIRQLIQ